MNFMQNDIKIPCYASLLPIVQHLSLSNQHLTLSKQTEYWKQMLLGTHPDFIKIPSIGSRELSLDNSREIKQTNHTNRTNQNNPNFGTRELSFDNSREKINKNKTSHHRIFQPHFFLPFSVRDTEKN